jgi:ubiquinone/menaquinone biosynthesis C-methylase UbiE
LIVKLLDQYNCKSKKILEVGCSNGYRLNLLKEKYSIDGYGIDPSLEAIEKGKALYPDIQLIQGTADNLLFKDTAFDIVIMGFCLYLCDRNDLFKIAFEADRVLKNNGLLIILDFYPPFGYVNDFSHQENLKTYKLKYDEMFTWNPCYVKIYQQLINHDNSNDISQPDDRIGVVIIKKMTSEEYPKSPYRE